MSYNRNNLNPNVWDVQRHNMPTFSQQQAPFLQQEFGIRQNFNNQNNFFQQNLHMNNRPGDSLPSLINSNHDFNNFNNRNYGNNFKNNNNNRANRPGPKFTKQQPQRPPIWENNMNRSIDNFSNNSNDNYQNNNFSQQNTSFSKQDTDMRPDVSISGLKGTLERIKKKDKSSNGEIDAICQKSASKISSKFISDIKTMNSEVVKDLINNPKQPYKKKVLNMQAQINMREQNRQKLRTLGIEDAEDPQADEAVDLHDMPESFLSELSKTVDMDLRSGDNSDENIDVVRKNLGNDFLTGSEMLLATGFSLLGDNEEPQFEIPEIPPLPKDMKIKPPPPDERPVPPPENEKVPFGCVSFYGDVRNWEESNIPKNPDPPSEQKNKIEIQSVEICDFGTGVSQRFDEKVVEEIKPVPPPDYGLNKIISPSPNISSASPMSSSTPKHSIAPSPSQSESNKKIATTSTPSVAKEKEVEKPMETKSIQQTNPQEESQAASIPVLISTAPVEVAKPVIEPLPSVEPSKTKEKPAESQQQKTDTNEDTGKRANETYGDYRKRMADQQKKFEEEQAKLNQPTDNTSSISVPQNNASNNENTPKTKGPQCIQNPPRDRNWMNKDRWGFTQKQNNNNNNRNNNNNNNNNNRKSRAEMDRGRDTWRNNNRSNDKRSDEIPDAMNYRFNSETNPEKLTQVLNPRPLDSNRSFNKRARDRTPVNTSPDRGFDESSYVPASDYRPCFYTIKEIMEMDTKIAKINDTIHECDKVIHSKQQDKLAQQKLLKKMLHDRRLLFENLRKHAAKNVNSSPSNESSNLSAQSSKAEKEKRLQTIVDQRKRKNDEILDETLKKKPATDIVESASAYEKAEKLRKEREEEERRQKKRDDKKRKKQLRFEREEAERKRIEEKIRLEEISKTKIQQEQKEKSSDIGRERSKAKSRDRSHDRSKTKSRDRSHERSKVSRENSIEAPKFTTFHKDNLDHLVYDSKDMKNFKISVKKLKFHNCYIEEFKNNGFTAVNLDEIDEPPPQKETPSERPKSVMSNEIISKPPTPDIEVLNDTDPFAGVEIEDIDYSNWNGCFDSHDSQIMQVLVVLESFLLAALQDGKVIKYDITSGIKLCEADQHRDICNSILYDDTANSVFSVSNDGFMNQLDLDNFNLVSFVDFGEQLQIIAKSKSNIFIGTKAGKIYSVKNDLIDKPEEALCSTGSMIYCIKAMKEGPRNILLVSSKSKPIQIRDANDGLLLREIAMEIPGLNIYDMIVDGGTIYYGTNSNEIYAVDFTNGALKKKHQCGNGAICLKMFDSYLIAACFDGNIYVINTKNDEDSTNICGPSNKLLSIDLWDDKIVATTTDKTLKIMNIPI